MIVMPTELKKKINLPVLKVKATQLFDLLLCAFKHPYDREGFKEAVLQLYPGREEKSVFRGMAIPTLRRLGLIIGYEDLIRLSSDGFLIVEALRLSHEQGKRTLRAHLLEFEIEREWCILKILCQKPYDKQAFVNDFQGHVEAPNKRQAMERLNDWLSYLCFSSLLACNEKLTINQTNFKNAQNDIEFEHKKQFFREFFFTAYKQVALQYKGVFSVEIEEVRKVTAQVALSKKNSIITSRQFDELLRSSIEFTTNKYTISFGRSMGADENLFKLQNNFYKTISIRFNS